MNRKLHNTVSALLASTALLVVSLMAASPAIPSASTAGFAAASLPAGADLLATQVSAPAAPLVQALQGPVDTRDSGQPAAPRRRHRQSVSMPYFSFAPQG